MNTFLKVFLYCQLFLHVFESHWRIFSIHDKVTYEKTQSASSIWLKPDKDAQDT